jgi:hypothetical protein
VSAPSLLGSTVETHQQNVQQVRIVPRYGFDVVEVIDEQAPVQAEGAPALRAGVDSSIDNLATLAADKPGFIPRVVNGSMGGQSRRSTNTTTSAAPSYTAAWDAKARVTASNG